MYVLFFVFLSLFVCLTLLVFSAAVVPVVSLVSTNNTFPKFSVSIRFLAVSVPPSASFVSICGMHSFVRPLVFLRFTICIVCLWLGVCFLSPVFRFFFRSLPSFLAQKLRHNTTLCSAETKKALYRCVVFLTQPTRTLISHDLFSHSVLSILVIFDSSIIENLSHLRCSPGLSLIVLPTGLVWCRMMQRIRLCPPDLPIL